MSSASNLADPQADSVHVKASPVNGLAEFVRNELTTSQHQSLLDRFEPAERHYFTGHVLDHEKVPIQLLNKFTVLAAELKGEQLESFGFRAGRFGAEQGIRGAYKFIIMVMSIRLVLEKAPFMWGRVYDAGRLTVDTTAGGARIHVTHFPSHPAGCARVGGWFQVIGERAGAKNLTIVHEPCAARGGSECLWTLTWDK